MAIFHLAVKTRSRAKGQCATSAAAYRAGDKIVDERTQQVYDYSRRSGVLHKEIIAPRDAPEWVRDRSTLWNAAESAETRKNSTVSREFEISLPAELTPIQRLELAQTFTKKLVEKHGFAADMALHKPGKGGDNRNFHAHILCTTRRLTPDGFGEKTRELDNQKSGDIEAWRHEWATLANAALEKAGHDVRIDHRSLKVQMIEAQENGEHEKAKELQRLPTIHLGPNVVHIERKGITTHIGERAREVHAVNTQIIDLTKERDARTKEAVQIVREGKREQQNERSRDPGRASGTGQANGSHRPTEDARRSRGNTDRTGARGAAGRKATKPNIGRIGTEPPPRARGRVQNVSELGMVRIEGRSERVLSGHVSTDMDQQGAKRNSPVRWNTNDLNTTHQNREPMTYGKAKAIWESRVAREKKVLISAAWERRTETVSGLSELQKQVAGHYKSKPPATNEAAYKKWESEYISLMQKQGVLTRRLDLTKRLTDTKTNNLSDIVALDMASKNAPRIEKMYRDLAEKEGRKIPSSFRLQATPDLLPLKSWDEYRAACENLSLDELQQRVRTRRYVSSNNIYYERPAVKALLAEYDAAQKSFAAATKNRCGIEDKISALDEDEAGLRKQNKIASFLHNAGIFKQEAFRDLHAEKEVLRERLEKARLVEQAAEQHSSSLRNIYAAYEIEGKASADKTYKTILKAHRMEDEALAAKEAERRQTVEKEYRETYGVEIVGSDLIRPASKTLDKLKAQVGKEKEVGLEPPRRRSDMSTIEWLKYQREHGQRGQSKSRSR